MRVQGIISLKDDQVDHLFGKLGTHSKCAGATLWLRDAFFADYRGRKVTISAPSRRVAACAVRTLLFQLSTKHGTDAALTTSSTWNYIDQKGEAHGPYLFQKMLRWAEQNAFHDESLPIQHSILLCWIPLWCLPLLGELANNNSNSSDPFIEPEEVAMLDWEETVRQLNEERAKGLLHDTTTENRSTVHTSTRTPLSDFPELQVYDDINESIATTLTNTSTNEAIDSYNSASASAAPMDYELSHAIQFDVAPDSVRAFVVVDTNILLSHMTFTERVFEKLAGSGPRVEVLLLVPWIVLNELDKLKDAPGGGSGGSSGRGRSDAARLALRRIRALTADRDSFVHAQSAAEHEKVVAGKSLSTESQLHRELRNDDLILQTCLHWHRGVVAALRAAGHRAAVFLLSNDKGLCTRAEANGVRCFAAMEFPGTVEALADQVPAVTPVSMEEAASMVSEELSLERRVAEIKIKDTYDLDNTQQKKDHSTSPLGRRQEEQEQKKPATSLLESPEQQQQQEISTAAPVTDPIHYLESIIERYLSSGVKYYRQQDLGDLWIEMLEERSRPPWRATTVLDVIYSHSTTFWEYLTRNELEQVRELERIIKRDHSQRHRHGAGHGHGLGKSENESTSGEGARLFDIKTAIAILEHLMIKLLEGLDKPRDQHGIDPPNPAEVPDFVSLGDARAALEQGVKEIVQLVGGMNVDRIE